jgi:hypothetical protein
MHFGANVCLRKSAHSSHIAVVVLLESLYLRCNTRSSYVVDCGVSAVARLQFANHGICFSN